LLLAHKSSYGYFEDVSSAGKAPEDWRSPRRFAYFGNRRIAHSVLECGGPPPLFPEANQTVPMLTGTAIGSQATLNLFLSAITRILWTKLRTPTDAMLAGCYQLGLHF
jgi:hypothetical protein